MIYHLKSVGIFAYPDAYLEMIPTPKWFCVITLFITYLSFVFGAREIMKSRASSSKVAIALRVHNLFVSAASLVLAVLLGIEAWSTWNKLGAYNAICSEEAFTPVSEPLRSIV